MKKYQHYINALYQDRLSLNAGQKYCRMLQESILQYFRPSLSYHLSLKPCFVYFLVAILDLFYCTTIKRASLKPNWFVKPWVGELNHISQRMANVVKFSKI